MKAKLIIPFSIIFCTILLHSEWFTQSFATAEVLISKALICSKCNKTISGRYIKVDGRVYHPECFTCGKCGKPIKKEYAYDKDGKYHPECFKAHKLPRCSVCGNPIEGKYIKDPWGNIAHETHRHQNTAMCSSCNRIISKSTSRGGFTYPDGRIICGYCSATAVTTQSHVRQYRKTVIHKLQASHISPIPSQVPIQLVSKTNMKKKRKSANPKGYTQCKKKYKNGKLVSIDQTVSILTGLPKLEFEGVLAHEFLHVWLNENNITMSDRNTEGFCNLGAMLVYQADGSPFAKVLLNNMEKDPDPEYGKGYRRMKKKLEKLGWPQLIKNIKKGKP